MGYVLIVSCDHDSGMFVDMSNMVPGRDDDGVKKLMVSARALLSWAGFFLATTFIVDK